VKSLTLICLICLEVALALYFAIGAAVAYGHVLPTTPLPYLNKYSPPPMPLTDVSRKSPKEIPLSSTIEAGTDSTGLIESIRVSPPSIATTSVSRNTLTNSTAKEGLASWYDRESCIKESGQAIMANGQPLDDNAMTAALWIVGKNGRPLKPDGRLVKITSVQDGSRKAVTCAWTDNGPGCVPRSEGVICDLTPRAMLSLAGEDGIREGRVEVTMEGI